MKTIKNLSVGIDENENENEFIVSHDALKIFYLSFFKGRLRRMTFIWRDSKKVGIPRRQHLERYLIKLSQSEH